MANEYTININVSGLSEESTSKQELDKVTGKSSQSGGSAKKTEKEATKTTKVIEGAVIYDFAKRNVNTIVNARLSTVGSRYGDTALQNRINNGVNQVRTVVGTGAGLLAAGSVGGAAGVALAAVTVAISSILEYSQNYYQYLQERQEESREIARASNRLGVVSAGAGRRNW